MAALLCAKRPEEFSFRKVEIGHELHSFFFFFISDCRFLVFFWIRCFPTPVVFYPLSFFELEDNCFTTLCWPLPYIPVTQLQRVYICPLPPSPTPLGGHRALGCAPCVLVIRDTTL